jgi:hypothetical protein
MEGTNMMLSGTKLKVAREYHTILTGDRQELNRLLAKAQDCAEDAISLLNSRVTKYEAENNRFISKIYDVLCEKGYGHKIRFKPEAKPEPTNKDKERIAYANIRQLPFFDVLERHGIAAKAAKAIARA